MWSCGRGLGLETVLETEGGALGLVFLCVMKAVFRSGIMDLVVATWSRVLSGLIMSLL